MTVRAIVVERGSDVGATERPIERSGSTPPAEPSLPLRELELTDELGWALVEAAPDAFVMTDERGLMLLVNRQAETLFGYDRADLLGQSVEMLLPEQLRQIHRAHRVRYRAEPRVRSMGEGLLLFGRRADGSEFPVEISLSPLETPQGLRVIAGVRDVSERAEVERLNRGLLGAFDALQDAVLLCDPDTLRFTYANAGAVAQTGYSREELLTMTPLHVKPNFTEASYRDLIDPLLTGEVDAVEITTVHRRKDGSDLQVEVIYQRIIDERHRPSLVAVIRDVSERRDVEDRLRAAEASVRVLADRERIARDLHDTVIQRLFAAGMGLQALSSFTDQPKVTNGLQGVIDELDTTIRELRSTIFQLTMRDRETTGLRASILAIVDEERDALGVSPSVAFNGLLEDLPIEVNAELVPSVREALSNVARHAHATRVDLSVTVGDDVVLQIVDNGIGPGDGASGGNGMRNMTDRAERLGGSCRLDAGAGGGAVLEWRVPNPRR